MLHAYKAKLLATKKQDVEDFFKNVEEAIFYEAIEGNTKTVYSHPKLQNESRDEYTCRVEMIAAYLIKMKYLVKTDWEAEVLSSEISW